MTRPPRRVRVTIAGLTRHVTVDDAGRASVEGTADPIEVQRLDPMTFSAVLDGRRTRVHLVETNSGRWASAAGYNVPVEVDTDGGSGTSPGHRAPDLTAPMPATVVAVLVAPGQAVQRGDVLVTLEAMKMELALRAPRDGVVATVGCAEGDLVQPGLPLVSLAPETDATSAR